MPEHTTDPEYLAFLESEAAELNSKRDLFFNRYGFYHDCHCDKDYAENKVMRVPECWVEMMDISFDRLAQYRLFLMSLAETETVDRNMVNDFLYAERG